MVSGGSGNVPGLPALGLLSQVPPRAPPVGAGGLPRKGPPLRSVYAGTPRLLSGANGVPAALPGKTPGPSLRRLRLPSWVIAWGFK